MGLTCRLIQASIVHHGQATADHLWSNISPWLREDVEFITSVDEVFNTAPYVGLHIRRGDKISSHEAKFVGAEVRETSSAGGGERVRRPK